MILAITARGLSFVDTDSKVVNILLIRHTNGASSIIGKRLNFDLLITDVKL